MDDSKRLVTLVNMIPSNLFSMDDSKRLVILVNISPCHLSSMDDSKRLVLFVKFGLVLLNVHRGELAY